MRCFEILPKSDVPRGKSNSAKVQSITSIINPNCHDKITYVDVLKAFEALYYPALVEDNFQCRHHILFLEKNLELLFAFRTHSGFA